MKIHVKTEAPGVQWIDLAGDLDFHSSPQLRKEFGKLLEGEIQKLLVDLKKVNYIDSSGLATFVELFQKMKKGGGKLILFNLTQPVRSVFEIAKLDSIFHLARDQEEALALAS